MGNDSTWKIAWFGVNSISGARSRAIGAKLRKRSSCGACVSGTPRLLEHGMSRLDKLLLSPADLAVEAYLRVMVEVSAAYQPEQLVDVVGRDASIACQPTYRLELLIVTSTWGTEPETSEDVFNVHVGLESRDRGYRYATEA